MGRPKSLLCLIHGKHEQTPRVVVVASILVANADNSTKQDGDPHYGGLLRSFYIVGPPVMHSPTKHNSTNSVTLDWSSVSERVVPPRSSWSVHTVISVTLLPRKCVDI